MLPEEDRQALKKNGYISTNKGIKPIDSPLQTHNRKSFSTEAQHHRQGERDPIKDSRATQPKATPVASNTRLYGSADAEERRHAGSSLKPKPTPNLRGMSADAAEHWSNPTNSQKHLSKPSGTMSLDTAERLSHSANHQKYPSKPSGITSADGAEKWSNPTKNKKPASKVSGTMSPNAAEHWSNSANHSKQPSKLAGTMSPNAAEHWSGSKHLSLKPKPIPGSAADLPQARKALQQTRNAYQNLKKLGRAYDAELNDLRRETSVAQARVDASQADKKLQDFPTQAQRSKSQNRGITEEIRSALAQRAYSAKEKYMGTQGLDSSGQKIKLTPPAPALEQSKQDKSWWDRGKDLLGGYVNFKKDVDIGAAKAVWDMGKGLGSLAKSGLEFQRDVYTNPQKAQQTLSNFSGNIQEIAKHPGQAWDALKQPYVDAINSGHPGEAFGRGFVDIGSFFVPGGAIGKAGEGANVLSKVSKVGDVTSTLSKVDKAGTTVSRATNVADKGLEKVANVTEQAGSRNRAFNRAFRTEQASIIRNDESHPLRFLLNDKGKLIRSVEAGHQKSFSSGNREILAIEDQSLNLRGKTERRRSIEIRGVPVERKTAEMWENQGLIPKGTVRNAPSHPGWTKGVKIKPGAVDVVERHLGISLPRLREITQTQGVPNWRSSKDREVYRLYTQTLRDVVQQRKQ